MRARACSRRSRGPGAGRGRGAVRRGAAGAGDDGGGTVRLTARALAPLARHDGARCWRALAAPRRSRRGAASEPELAALARRAAELAAELDFVRRSGRAGPRLLGRGARPRRCSCAPRPSTWRQSCASGSTARWTRWSSPRPRSRAGGTASTTSRASVGVPRRCRARRWRRVAPARRAVPVRLRAAGRALPADHLPEPRDAGLHRGGGRGDGRELVRGHRRPRVRALHLAAQHGARVARSRRTRLPVPGAAAGRAAQAGAAGRLPPDAQRALRRARASGRAWTCRARR